MKKFLLLTILSIMTLSALDVVIKPTEWIEFNHISGVKIEDDCFIARFAGIDPHITSKKFTPVKAEDLQYVIFDYQIPSNCASKAQIFWKTTEVNKFSSAMYLNLNLINDGEWHTYRVNMKSHKNWQGEISCIRFDPAIAPETLERFKLRNFRLSKAGSIIKNTVVEINLKTQNTKPQLGDYPRSMFSNTGALLINGKPEFILGTGDIPVVDNNPFGELAQAGFNLVTFSAVSKGLIEEIQKNNLNVMLAIMPDKKETTESFAKKVSLMYERYPQLEKIVAAYLAVDEPVWIGFPLKPLREAYSFYRGFNPRRPVWMNHAPRNSTELLKEYNAAADITGCDIYPVPDGGHSDLEDRTLSSVGAYTDKMFKTALPGQPIWMYLQAYARAKTIPTYHETRFMAYNAIMHGTMGIFYYGLRHLKWPNKMWPQLQNIGLEIRSLNDILVAPWNSELIEKAGIEIRFKKIDGELYIFVANTINVTQKLMLSTDTETQKMFVLFENREVEVKNTFFTDIFEPYAVHIYAVKNIEKKQATIRTKSDLTWISKSNSYWIWHSKLQRKNYAIAYFRRPFDVDEIPANAKITITVDNNYRLFCNGKLIGEDIKSSQGGWMIAENYNLKPFLRANSQNIIAVEGINDTGMAGLWAEITLGDQKILTDERWRVSNIKYKNWQGVLSDENWESAKTYGQPPCEPWNSFMVFKND